MLKPTGTLYSGMPCHNRRVATPLKIRINVDLANNCACGLEPGSHRKLSRYSAMGCLRPGPMKTTF